MLWCALAIVLCNVNGLIRRQLLERITTVLKKECLKIDVEIKMMAVIYNVLGGLENALD